jgi:hypothetical protein
MDVNNPTSANVATSVGALVDNAQRQQPPESNNKEQPAENQNSTVVKLSDKAQQLSRSEASTKESVAPPSTPPVLNEHTSSQVNTHA